MKSTGSLIPAILLIAVVLACGCILKEQPVEDSKSGTLDNKSLNQTLESTAENTKMTESTAGVQTTKPVLGDLELKLIGSWRIYSEAVFYDRGGNDYLDTPSSRLLELNEDETWKFGDSSGTWATAPVEASDWGRWGVSDYGPSRKVILNGWNKGVGDGPIEESGDGVDFFWVIYHAEQPVLTWPGQVQIKFGYTNL
ncbi:MAG: hypothetical protein V1703_01770 [Candidatus Altiarchaeota archaeon]